MPNEWAGMIKSEIIDLKIRLDSVERQLNELGYKSSPEGEGKDIYSRDSIFDREADWSQRDKLEAMDLVKATYSIREATKAMRGYLMLLDQAGLSKEQKKMVRDLEYAMMMIMKAATALNLLLKMQQLMAAGALGPSGILMYGIFAGGSMAASVAYGSKLSGGLV